MANTIRVINFDNAGQRRSKRNVALFPDITRCGIFGPSGCGKTNVLLTILMYKKPLSSIYLCSRTASQHKYELLARLVEQHNNAKPKRRRIKFATLTVETLPLPEKIEENSTVIFDDILTENQDKVAIFFMRGRHRSISCYYLAQSYNKIPKKSGIRENFNFLIIFRQDRVNLHQIYNEHVTSGISFEQFSNICAKCWRENFGFLTVDLESDCKFVQNFGKQIKF